jgi:hypothetical protein
MPTSSQVAAVIAPSSELTSRDHVVPIEFAGWLPAFRDFGNCGSHPLFDTLDDPPSGYYFVRSRPVLVTAPSRFQLLAAALAAGLTFLLRGLTWPLRAFRWLLVNSWRWGPVQCLAVLFAALRMFAAFLRAGGRIVPTIRFLKSRYISSQLMVPRRTALVFLTSVPFTYGQHPWVIEIEDATSLFFPFHRNGQTAMLDLARSPYFPLVKVMLESGRCRGIITHMRSTAETLPRLFASDRIATKVTHVPLGVSLPRRWQRHTDDEHLNLLFTCSWHQHPDSFFLRGGLEVLDAFDILHTRYPHLRLTLRSELPPLGARYQRILQENWVRVIGWYLEPGEMAALMLGTHLFLLPAARVHVVSILKAMSYGLVVVASDGWGIEEYVRHDHNGVIVAGRHGKASWMDLDTGMLRENYDVMHRSDQAVVHGLVEAISELVEDGAKRRRLGNAARRDVATRYSLDGWNRGLKAALDRAVS